MDKKKYMLIALVVLAVVVVTIIVLCTTSKDTEAPNCEQLLPVEYASIPQDEYVERIMLDFEDKSRLAWGKYGFICKFETDKPIEVFQRAESSTSLTDKYYFGIYKDEKLSQPIEEKNRGEIWDIYGMLEREEVSLEDYEGYDYNKVELEPGTYYFAVYTTRSADEHPIAYEAYWNPVER